jgi:hypothetical protein
MQAGSTVQPPTGGTGYTEVRQWFVTIEGVTQTTCDIARKEPAGPVVRGTIMMASGATGSAWLGGTAVLEAWFDELNQDGWRIVQVRWPSNQGWHRSDGTGRQGYGILTGRIATVVKHCADNWHTDGELMVFGSSGGGSQWAYALSRYHLGSLVDRAIMQGGPPHGDIYGGCRRFPNLAYENQNTVMMDESYQAPIVDMDHCDANRPDEAGSWWWWDSLITGNLAWPETAFLWGQNDTTTGPAHGRLVADKLSNGKVYSAFDQGHGVGVWTPFGRNITTAVIGRLPTIRQSVAGVFIGTAGTSLALSLPEPVIPGNTLVVVHRSQTSLANMTAPAGFTTATDGTTLAQTTASTAGLRISTKVATGGEQSGLSVGTSTSVLQTADIIELDGAYACTGVTLAPDPGVTVTGLTIGPSATPSAPCLAIAAIGALNNLGTISFDWTGGFGRQWGGNRLITAARSQRAAAPLTTSTTWTTAQRVAGIMVVFT